MTSIASVQVILEDRTRSHTRSDETFTARACDNEVLYDPHVRRRYYCHTAIVPIFSPPHVGYTEHKKPMRAITQEKVASSDEATGSLKGAHQPTYL